MLMDDEWSIRFPDIHLSFEKQQFSDHNPIIVQTSQPLDWGPKPFRLYNMWFNNPEFKEMLSKEWKALKEVLVHHKLKALKGPVKRWSKEKYWDLDRKIEQLSQDQEILAILGENGNLNEEELSRQIATFVLLQKMMLRKEHVWR